MAALAVPTTSWEARTSANLGVAVTTSQAIAAVSVSNSSFAGGAPSGTVVGTIGVTMSPASPPFSGTLSLSGTNAPSFQIARGNLETTGVVRAGTYKINVVAIQAGATGSPFTQPETITGTDPLSASCPKRTAYPDGCSGAPTPAGTIQYPSLLAKYGANRPPWNVAGVDYYVGMPAGQTLTDWHTLSGVNITNGGDSTGEISCKSGSVTFNGVDFTVGGTFQYFYVPPGGCTSFTVTNSKFGCPQTGSYHLFYLNNAVTFTLKNNTMNWIGCESSGWQGGNQDTVLFNAGGTGVIQYNYISHTANHPFTVAGVSSYDFRYNFLDNVVYDNKIGNHMNYMQQGGNNANILWAFNTTYQSATCCETGGEGPQFYSNGGGTETTPTLANNTMVAAGGNMSYMVHGSTNSGGNGTTILSGTGTNSQNYFDPTGSVDGNSNSVYYPKSMITPWTSSGNINMVTGAVITPQ